MSRKSDDLYSAVFKYIEKKVFQMEAKQFMCDFETGLRSSIRKCYPKAILYGCWFHFCSALRRRMLSHHLYKLISENLDAAMIYQMMLSLPLLPSKFVVKGYKFIKKEARKRRLFNNFDEFFEYFDSFWMKLVSSTSNSFLFLEFFILTIFRSFFSLILKSTKNEQTSLSVAYLNMRTTSSVEGFNSFLNRSVRLRDHFFKFVESLRLHESRKTDELFNIIHDKVLPKKQLQ